MGTPKVLEETEVSVEVSGVERCWPAIHVDMGNPHAVAWVDDLADVGPLLDPPVHDDALYPDGVNVEFVVRRGPAHVAMRVHERGSGETRSCGTGACAVMVAAALADDAERDTDYRIDLPGGTLADQLDRRRPDPDDRPRRHRRRGHARRSDPVTRESGDSLVDSRPRPATGDARPARCL